MYFQKSVVDFDPVELSFFKTGSQAPTYVVDSQVDSSPVQLPFKTVSQLLMSPCSTVAEGIWGQSSANSNKANSNKSSTRSSKSSGSSSKSSASSSGISSLSASSSTSSRFSSPVSEADVEELQKLGVPRNTNRDTAWSVKVYTDWQNHRNAGLGKTDYSKRVPALNENITEERLNFWLIRFVMEVNRKDGTPYPAVTLKHLCIGLQRHLRTKCNRAEISLFESPKFAAFRRTLDSKMKELNKKGIHLHKKQAQPLTPDHESVLWDRGVFNLSSGRGVQNAVYFYTSKIYGLRACDEHYNLRCDQFTLGSDSTGDFVRYYGKVCKNNQGGLQTSGRVQFKNICQYAQRENPRCYVRIMSMYLEALGFEGWLYRRPLASTFVGELKYSKTRLGVHQFETFMQRLMQEAGIEGYFTGHSGKVNI